MSINSFFNFSVFDSQMMAKAIRLAEKGQYSTTPNPHVGCVIVDEQNTIVGEGFHVKAGLGHAEVNALLQAGSKSIGATCYVTLEPCAHTNRTGPCALALVRAKVKRVVIACSDPNPKVAGKGIKILEDAGITVHLGLMHKTAENLNQHFFWRLQHERPFVTVKLAASIDGKTALANGQSKWITGSCARKDVQVQRAKACAILTGTDTVIADDPQLNVRPSELPIDIAEQFSWREQQPLRVVVDSANRIDATQYQMFSDMHATLVYNLNHNVKLSSVSNKSKIEQHQIKALNQQTRDFVDLSELMLDLGRRQINHLWVEAGAALSGALFDQGLVDELMLYQAPMLLGSAGRSVTNYTSPERLSEAMKGNIVDLRQVGADIRTTIRF